MTAPSSTSTNIVSILKMSGAFVALVIGSGFATGQEAMQFFVAYNYKGMVGIFISLFLFIYVCTKLMRAGYKYKLIRNEDVFVHFCGKPIGIFLTWYTMIFIVALYAIMLSGAGATLEQSYGIPIFIGSGIMALLSMLTLLMGLRKIVDVISMVGPVIVAVTVFIAIVAIVQNPAGISTGAEVIPTIEIMSASPHWLFSSVLYVGLSIPGLASFLPAIGATATSDNDVTFAGVIGPLFFVGAILLVALALMSKISEVNGTMIPIMALADSVLPIYGAIFAVVIFLGIYTTATPLLWSVCSRFAEDKSSKYNMLVVIFSCSGFFGGMVLPFDRLVNLIFPTLGYAGLLFLSFTIFRDVKNLFARESLMIGG
jgi:uncharacterized membrane protein YkvI